MGQRGKSFRVIVTYTGFSEAKNKQIIKVAGRRPTQESFDPLDSKCEVMFVYQSKGFATKLRTRLLAYASGKTEWKERFSVSKVITGD